MVQLTRHVFCRNVGDVDNRVRNIAKQLGLKTSIWTQGFDTNDVSWWY